MIPNDVELNVGGIDIGTKRCRIKCRVELILIRNDVELNNDRVELILVPNDVELNNDRVELILIRNDVELR